MLRTKKLRIEALCVHNFIMYLILAVTDAVMWFNGTDEISCGFLNVLGKSTIFITFEHTALVSFVWFHLASKTAANEEPNLLLISALTITLYLFKHVFNIISVVASTTKFEVACLQDSNLEVNPMIGIGTRISGGCTSGHGISGIGRFSLRSIIATITFMIVGVLTVLIKSFI